MNNDIQILIQKLDAFIRKYYFNKIIKGVLLSVFLILALIYFTTIIEYFGHFSSGTRSVFFYSLLILFLCILIYYIIYPIIQFFKIGNCISYRQAAEIISKHFYHLEDKLINTLELNALLNSGNLSPQLITASISQRVHDLSPVPFRNAIRFNTNFKYVKLILTVFILVFLTYIFWPSVIQEGSKRIINYNQFYAPVAPFQFSLINDSLNIIKGESIEIQVNLTGKILPSEVFIEYSNNKFLMKKNNNNLYTYKFVHVNNPIQFNFEADNLKSKPYHINTLPNPSILKFSIFFDYPDYIGKQNELLNNIGDFTVPYGTSALWKFYSQNTNTLKVIFEDSVQIDVKKDSSLFLARKTIYKNSNYTISLNNKFVQYNDYVSYTISVIPDLYPDIELKALNDSNNISVYHFFGLINDDYGFKDLKFCYQIDDNKINQIDVPINRGTNSQEFYYSFDFSQIDNTEGSNIEYYFEVRDNDVLHNFKSSRTEKSYYKVPTRKEIEELSHQSSQAMHNQMNESYRMAKDLKNDINKLQENSIKNDYSNWEKSQKMKDIFNKQKKLEDLCKEMLKNNNDLNKLNNALNKEQKELLEKQKKLEEMMNKLLTDELKDLLKQIQELQKELTDKKFDKKFDKFELSYDDFLKQLDKNIEMMKKFEVEQKIDNVIKDLENVAEKQKNLSEQVKQKNQDLDELKQKQEDQKNEFNDLVEQYKEAQKLNKDLEQPFNLEEFQEQTQEIQNEFDEGQENLDKNKKNKASKSQQQNSNTMKKMAQSMQQMMESAQMQMMSQNIGDLQQILENLITFSFDQENTMIDLREVNNRDPKYVDIVKIQKNVGDNFQIIQDSLYSLAKNVPQINNIITKEVLTVNENLSDIIDNLEERHKSTAQSNQQQVMTSANNLALLLSEVLEQMQKSMMQGDMSGKSNSTSKSNMPSMKKMKSQQQSLKSQLQQMLNQMKQGNKQGKGQMPSQQMNEQLAKMISDQEKFQKMLDELSRNSSTGSKTQKLLQQIKKMVEENKKDISLKNITPETLLRQDKIITRLLEAENAERQREIDKKREANEAKNSKISNPDKKFSYKEKRNTFDELLNNSNFKMNSFYRNKYKTYIIKLNQE